MNTQRGIILAGNWKMNLLRSETRAFFEAFLPSKSAGLRHWIFPPHLSIDTALQKAQPKGTRIGAQNAWGEPKGAFTGELSAAMLKEAGVDLVLLGHSERRQYFGETDESVAKRAEGLAKQGLELLVCVGETRSEREAEKTEAVLQEQLRRFLTDTFRPYFEAGTLNLAYEPVWAIGTGLTATPAQAEQAHAFIREQLKMAFGATVSEKILLLYGGSANPKNIRELLQCPNVDGALVGGASVDPASFAQMSQEASSLLSS